MKLKKYLDDTQGKSILSSSSADGMVTSAIYSKPHVFDNKLIEGMKRRHISPEEDRARGPKYLVHFRVDKILPLVGDRDAGITIR
jgi:hypothetical protein